MVKRLLSFAIVLVGTLIMVGWVVQRCSAGDTIVFHAQHINVATRFDTWEVGDEKGHAIAYFQAKGVGIRREGPPEPFYKCDLWGTADIRADGTATEHGFGKFTFSDGSTILKNGRAHGEMGATSELRFTIMELAGLQGQKGVAALIASLWATGSSARSMAGLSFLEGSWS